MGKDKNLLGNKRIEDAIAEMYKNLTEEKLAKVLYVLRDRAKEGGHLVVAIKPGDSNRFDLRTITTPDGKKWFAAFTSFDEELKKKENIVSGFTAEITGLFDTVLNSDEITGLIINPWDKALKLTKAHIEVIK